MSKTKSSRSEWGYELYVLLQNFANERQLDTVQMLGFLTSSICGTLAMNGYENEFVKETFDKIYNNYVEKKKRFDNKLDYLFFKELRSRMSRFNDREIGDCLQSRDFWEVLIKHVGLENDPKIKEIMNRKPEPNAKPQSRKDFFIELEKIFEDAMPEIINAVKEMKRN